MLWVSDAVEKFSFDRHTGIDATHKFPLHVLRTHLQKLVNNDRLMLTGLGSALNKTWSCSMGMSEAHQPHSF